MYMNKGFLKNIFSLRTGQLLFIGLLSLTACEDKPARLSGGVLPDGEVIKGLNWDRHELISENVMRDAVKTSDASYGIIGNLTDTVFGQSKAGFVTDFSIGSKVQFKVDVYMPPTNNVPHDTIYEDVYRYKFNNNIDTIADTWRVDSIVLNLQYQYNNWYGDMTAEQMIKVFELGSSLESNADEYYSNTNMNDFFPTLVGEKLVHPNNDVPDTLKSDKWDNLWQDPDALLNDPQYLWDVAKIDTLYPDFNGHTLKTKYWNIKLSNELAERIFNATEGELTNTLSFKGLFHGLYLTADESENTSGEGNLTKMNILGSSSAVASHLTIHLSRDHKYLNTEEEIRDTTSTYSYTFPINKENVRFNTYQHTADPRIKLEDPSTHSLYVQGMAGVYSRFSLPDEVRFWADSLSLIQDHKLEGEPYRTTSNIEFYLEVDTLSYPSNQGGIQRYPIPQSLSILWYDDNNKLTTPIYTTVVNGRTITSPVFGSDSDANGSRSGVGELVFKRQENEDGTYHYEYLYRFIMRSDYFNYIMRQLDNARFEKGWDIDSDEFKTEFERVFKNEFYIGPSSTTANFQRVKLFSGAHPERPFKMNIKYYHYIPR